jgi:hypothetical protein
MTHKTIADWVSVAGATNADAFLQRHDYPFLFGREVLEEEFRFSTVLTDLNAHDHTAPKTHDVLRIRHWVIAVKKPPEAPAKDRVFLGRSETNDLCVPHKTVSKLHAYLTREQTPTGSKWFVIDAGSANGTRHNGVRIAERTKIALTDLDTVVFGRCVFQWLTARALYDRILQYASTGL